MENVIVGYKVFNPDWTCRDYDFKTEKDAEGNPTAIGSVHTYSGEVEICRSGFHFCEKVTDCFNYYSFDPSNKVALVEGTDCTEQKGDSKRAAKTLKIVKEISWEELLVIANSGQGNTGHSNTGDRNTGHSNTGYWNTGNWNTGKWNTVNNEAGHFNTEEITTIRVFNKPCSLKVWNDAYKPDFLFFDLTYWDDVQGKQKEYEYKEAFMKSWLQADKINRMKVKDLPNFDSDVFFEISGIRMEDFE